MFQAPTGSGGGLTVLLLQMAAIGLVFYFLILRPSGQARKKHAELLTNLKKGDEVMTSGGHHRQGAGHQGGRVRRREGDARHARERDRQRGGRALADRAGGRHLGPGGPAA